MRCRIAVVGSLNEDVLAAVERLPGRGETVIATGVWTAPGGKGANQAAAAGRLGAGVLMVGRVGTDDAGDRMLEALARVGVDVRRVVRTHAAPTGTATIAVERGSGENLILVVPGANAQLAPSDVELPDVRDADVVLLQLEVPLPTVVAAARSAGGRVVLNPAPARPLPEQLLVSIDVLVPNEHELLQLTGSSPGHAGIAARAASLASRCSPGASVVVTLGARGAVLVAAGRPALLQPPPSVDAVDATGAGDCFCGALCAALADGADLPAAVRWAVTAAALSTTGPGARAALPDAAAVQAMLARTPAARPLAPA